MTINGRSARVARPVSGAHAARVNRAASAAIEHLEARQLFAVGPAAPGLPGYVLGTAVDPATGTAYHLLAASSWADADSRAVSLGGRLVSINSAAEQQFLRDNFSASAPELWIGINDAARTGRFRWSSGEAVTYTNWYPGEPNDQWYRGEVWGTLRGEYDWKWNDLGPDSPLPTGTPLGIAEVKSGADLTGAFARSPAAAATAGGPVEASFAVVNSGRAATATPAGVTWYLSADGAFDATDVALPAPAGAGEVGALGPNATVTIGGSFTLPANTPAGTYRILARVDAANAVAEADETNNVVASDAFDVGGTRTPVFRTVTGFVRDANGNRLHGVRVTLGKATAYTDYDRGSRALDRDSVGGDFELRRAQVGWNVRFGETFGRFVPTDAAEHALAVTAADLTGATYARQAPVGDHFTYNPAAADGGLADTVALRGVTLTDYAHMSDDGKTVYAHKDLRNDRHSHRLSAKVPAAVAATTRYEREVEAVTAKLAALGFRGANGAALAGGTGVVAVGPDQAAALKLFADVVEGYAATDPAAAKVKRAPKAAGVLTESLLAKLNAADAATPMWTPTVAAPAGFAPGVADTWLNRATAARVASLAAALPTVTQFVVTAASPATGATDGGGDHSRSGARRAGAEFDLRWTDVAGTSAAPGAFWEPLAGVDRDDVKLLGGRKYAVPDPAGRGVTWRYVAGYDPARTATAINALLAGGKARVRFNDPQLLLDAGAIEVVNGKLRVLRSDLVPAAGYDDRLGVRVAYGA